MKQQKSNRIRDSNRNVHLMYNKKEIAFATSFSWAQKGLNLRPSDYESAALTN